MTNLYRFLKLLFISLLISLISLSDLSSVAFAQSLSQNKELNLSQNPSFFKENLKNVRSQEDIKSISPFISNEFIFYLNQFRNSSFQGKKANQDFPNFLGDINIDFTGVRMKDLNIDSTGVRIGFLTVNIPVNIEEVSLFKTVNINNYNKDANPNTESFDWYQKGQEELEKQNYKYAVTYFSNALSLNTYFSEAYAQRGFAYFNLGNFEDALDNFNKALSGSQPQFKDHIKNPKTYVDPLILRGYFYLKIGNYKAAFTDFTEAIKRNPEVYQSYLNRAVVYLVNLDYTNAIKDLDMAIKKDLNSQDALLMRGSINAELGKYKNAISDFQEVIDLNQKQLHPKSLTEAYYKKGLAELNLGNYQTAIDDLDKAKKYNSNYPELSYNKGLAYSFQGNLDQAISSYNQEINYNPKFLEVYYQRGKNYYQKNDFEKAKNDLEKVVDRDKQYIEAEIKLANTYFDLAVKSNKDPIFNLKLSEQVYKEVIQHFSNKFEYKDYLSQAESRRKIIKNFLEDKAIFPVLSSLQDSGNSLVYTIAISPNGDRIASGGDKNIVKISTFKQVQEERKFDNQDQVYTLVFNPHKNNLAIGGVKSLKILDLNFGKFETFPIPNDSTIRSLVYDSTGQTLISAGENTLITFWDQNTGEQIWTIPTPTKKINSLALSPNGKWLVSGGDDKVLRIYDYKTRKEIRTLDKDHGHKDIIRAIVISPDNQLLISGSNDKTIKIWDLNSGKFRYQLPVYPQAITSLAITSDSQFLAIGADDGAVRIWDFKQDKELATLSFPSSYVQSVAFTHDNKFLVAGGDKNAIKIWKMPFQSLF